MPFKVHPKTKKGMTFTSMDDDMKSCLHQVDEKIAQLRVCNSTDMFSSKTPSTPVANPSLMSSNDEQLAKRRIDL